jgi:hypothetical protein
MTRQFISCEFTEGGKPYTFHNDSGIALKAGDKVIAETARGEATVTVVGLVLEAPPYETRAIKSLAPVEAQEVEVLP